MTSKRFPLGNRINRVAVHHPFPQKRPSNETATGRCLKMVLYTRGVKLGNFMFQSVVDIKQVYISLV